MTTSHRPTFESRKGRDLQPTSIVHSRQVAAHRQLKYRKTASSLNSGSSAEEKVNIDETDAREKFDELKHDLIKRENEHYGKTDGEDDYKQLQNKQNKSQPLRIQDKPSSEVSKMDEETFEEKRKRIAAETEGIDDSSDEEFDENEDANGQDHSDYESSEGDDDEDSEDDEAELLKELEKIKKERAEAKEKKESKEKEESALASNPLLNPNKPIRKNWRQDKVFNYKNNSEKTKTDDDYVNDLLRSDFHQKFLNKYVK